MRSKDKEALGQNIINGAGNLVAHLQALGRLGSTLHILFHAHGHSLPTALIAIQLYPHQLAFAYVATHLAIGQKHTALRANIHKATIARNADNAYITQLAFAHFGQLHAGSESLAGVQV